MTREEEFEELLRRSSLGVVRTPEWIKRAHDELGMKNFRRELDELLQLEEPAPANLRRIAELTEIVHSDEAARQWWEKAASAGDLDAVDYLMELIAEGESGEGAD